MPLVSGSTPPWSFPEPSAYIAVWSGWNCASEATFSRSRHLAVFTPAFSESLGGYTWCASLQASVAISPCSHDPSLKTVFFKCHSSLFPSWKLPLCFYASHPSSTPPCHPWFWKMSRDPQLLPIWGPTPSAFCAQRKAWRTAASNRRRCSGVRGGWR